MIYDIDVLLTGEKSMKKLNIKKQFADHDKFLLKKKKPKKQKKIQEGYQFLPTLLT